MKDVERKLALLGQAQSAIAQCCEVLGDTTTNEILATIDRARMSIVTTDDDPQTHQYPVFNIKDQLIGWRNFENESDDHPHDQGRPVNPDDTEPGWNVLAFLGPVLLLIAKARVWLHDRLHPDEPEERL